MKAKDFLYILSLIIILSVFTTLEVIPRFGFSVLKSVK